MGDHLFGKHHEIASRGRRSDNLAVKCQKFGCMADWEILHCWKNTPLREL